MQHKRELLVELIELLKAEEHTRGRIALFSGLLQQPPKPLEQVREALLEEPAAGTGTGAAYETLCEWLQATDPDLVRFTSDRLPAVFKTAADGSLHRSKGVRRLKACVEGMSPGACWDPLSVEFQHIQCEMPLPFGFL